MAETDGIELEHHDEERHKVSVAPRSLNTSDAFNVLVRSTTHKVTDMLHAWARGEKKLAPDAETPVDAASGREKGGGMADLIMVPRIIRSLFIRPTTELVWYIASYPGWLLSP